MCVTVVINDPKSCTPIMLGINRDEHEDRATLNPDAHWPNLPSVCAPKDRARGGTWMGVNHHGMFAILINQSRAQSIQTKKRSRGDIVLAFLRARTREQGFAALERINVDEFLGFHVIAGSADEIRLYSTRDSGLEANAVNSGAHIVSAQGMNAQHCHKYSRFRPQLGELLSHTGAERERNLKALLKTPSIDHPKDGMTVDLGGGYRTRSSAIVKIAANGAVFLSYANVSSNAPPAFRPVPIERAHHERYH